MKKTIKKVVSLLLVAFMVFGSAPLTGFVGLELPELKLFGTKAEAAVYKGTCGENLTWTLDESSYKLVINGKGDMKDFTALYPSGSDAPWYKYHLIIKSVEISDGVTSIGDNAFYECDDISSVTIGKSVTNIGSTAFKKCNGLFYIYYKSDIAGWCGINFKTPTSNPMYYGDKLYINGVLLKGNIIIPDSVTSIDDYTFLNCSDLTSVTIPESVTSIGDSAFKGCASLESVTNFDNLINICSSAFYNSAIYNNSSNWENDVLYIGNYLIKARDSISGSCEIKDGTKLISDCAFYDCNNLTNITIPDSVTNIGDLAFGYCSALTSITIPDSITSIEKNTFYSCDNLTSITIPNGVINIGEGAYYSCENIVNIIICDSVVSIEGAAFAECINIKSIVIPNSVTSIGDCSFDGCTNLEYAHIPASVTNIGSSILDGTTAYICSETNDCFAKTYAEKNDIEFRLCAGHGDDGHSHIPGEWITTADPDCTNEGTKIKYCIICKKEMEKATVGILGHDIIIDKDVKPTCTETGLTEGQHCSRCDDMTIEQEVVPIKGHDIIIDEAVEATCTETGLTEGQHCSRCDDMTIEQEVVPVKGHDIIIDEAVESTCTETGLTEGQHCSRCDEMTIEQEVVPVKGHDIIIDEAVDSTCTETGLSKGQHCSRCDDMTIEQEVVPVKGHDIIIDEAVESTCTETGLTEGQHCSRCDDMTIEQEVVPVKGHDIIIDEAVESTCTETGLTEGQHCSRCNEMTIEQEVVPVKGHDIIIDEAVESTCIETGLTEGQHCSRCDEMTIEQEIVPIKPHNHTVKFDSAKHWKECVCGSIIEKQNHSFISSNICECGFKRIVDSTIKIKNNNGSKTINYGETLKLTAIVTDKPVDAKIYWFVNGVRKGEGETFNITFESGTMIVEVKLVDENGVVYQDTNGNEISDSENVTVNNGFFQKIISFFKNLFGMNRIVIQSIFKDTF